jgi:hypothetical protein
MDVLARQVGAKTREEFQKEQKLRKLYWKDNYAEYLSEQIGSYLQKEEGLILEVQGIKVRFYCFLGKFIPWKNEKIKKKP